ncbi:MAG: serine hydrolase domain-containing protein [Candidatus Heimdallarchaeaceae archaeon]|jgi:CubicO group peptidase (beta-lactamase class C family)
MKKRSKKSIIWFSSLLLTMLILPVFSLSGVAAVEPTDIFDADFDAQVEILMGVAKAPSLAFSAVKGTEVYYSNGYGEQSDVDLVYYTSTMTQMITATAILQMQEQGLLSLNDPINDYLPYIIENPYYPEVELTIMDLLTHSSEIKNNQTIADVVLGEIYTFEDMFYELLNENGTDFDMSFWYDITPGSVYKFAWINYDILAYIVEIITEDTFEKYLTDNIFTPLGMSNTHIGYTDYGMSELAKRYEWNSTSGLNAELAHIDHLSIGSAGVLSTVDDMGKFLLAHMNDGMYNDVQILNSTSIETMHDGTGDMYGLGWTIYSTGYEGYVSASWLGYGYALAKGEVGVVIFTNQETFESGLAGKHQDILDYIVETAEELKTIDTPFSFWIVPILFAFIGVLIVLRKRK